MWGPCSTTVVKEPNKVVGGLSRVRRRDEELSLGDKGRLVGLTTKILNLV